MLATAPGAKLSATIAAFSAALQRRRRGAPVRTSTRRKLCPSIGKLLGKPASLPRLNEAGSSVRHQPPQYGTSVSLTPHRDGGQSQFVTQPLAVVRTNDRIARVADWMALNLNEEITVEGLAQRAAMSVRTFSRRFRAATGATPIEWLLRLRVRHAQDLLEATDLPIDHIAQTAGFKAPETLRHHFRRVVGTSPSKWRSSFRGS